MARIAGVNIPITKKVYIGLTSIYGIGQVTSMKICEKAGVNPHKRIKELTDEETSLLREVIESNYKVEGILRKDIVTNIRTLQSIKCYRGIRHTKRLPCRGQRTHTNARTLKGKAVAIAGKKQVSK